MNTPQKIGLWTAVAIVIANMVGTGVFGSLGFQLLDIKTGWGIMALWLVGGVAALAGALSYGEIGALFPRSGGEYNYLSKIYHPSVGFLSGFVSATVGFAAPVAAAAMLLGNYSHTFLAVSPKLIAMGIVVGVTAIHLFQIKVGGGFQGVMTALKVGFLVFFAGAAFFVPGHGDISWGLNHAVITDIANPAFAVALFWVSYAYSGWNAAAYLSGEIRDPGKNLPKALLIGTLVVTAIYLLLNFVFLHAAPVKDLVVSFGPNGPSNTETGHVAARFIFGDLGAKLMSGAISVLLISTISAMVMAGPRVNMAMGEDFRLLSFFAKKTAAGIPVLAILVQCGIALVLIATSTFDQIVVYTGFTLNLFAVLTVVGVIVMRFKAPKAERPYRTWGYPVTPIVFAAIGVWLMVYGIVQRPKESVAGFATVLLGLVIYAVLALNNKKKA